MRTKTNSFCSPTHYLLTRKKLAFLIKQLETTLIASTEKKLVCKTGGGREDEGRERGQRAINKASWREDGAPEKSKECDGIFKMFPLLEMGCMLRNPVSKKIFQLFVQKRLLYTHLSKLITEHLKVEKLLLIRP